MSKTVDDANCPIPSVKVSGSASTCVAGEYIYDPCWVETGHPARRSVLCMSVPWSHEVSRLLTEAKVVTEAPSPDWPPWAVELADSQQCRVATGAHDSLDPSRGDDAGVVDYYCGEQEARWLGLLRGIDDTHPVWTVRAARYDNDRWESVDPQRIATAWF